MEDILGLVKFQIFRMLEIPDIFWGGGGGER